MSIQLNRRVAAIENRFDSETDTSWVRVIDYGEEATEEQRNQFERGMTKAKAESLSVIKRVIIH
jgi:alkylated DNA nucleotide flippase Atl1